MSPALQQHALRGGLWAGAAQDASAQPTGPAARLPQARLTGAGRRAQAQVQRAGGAGAHAQESGAQVAVGQARQVLVQLVAQRGPLPGHMRHQRRAARVSHLSQQARLGHVRQRAVPRRLRARLGLRRALQLSQALRPQAACR